MHLLVAPMWVTSYSLTHQQALSQYEQSRTAHPEPLDRTRHNLIGFRYHISTVRGSTVGFC